MTDRVDNQHIVKLAREQYEQQKHQEKTGKKQQQQQQQH